MTDSGNISRITRIELSIVKELNRRLGSAIASGLAATRVRLALLDKDPAPATAGQARCQPRPTLRRVEAPGPVAVTLNDLARVIPVKETASTHLHELRCVPLRDQFAWETSPYLVNEAVAWIMKKAAELRSHTLLLATAMSNDVAIGIPRHGCRLARL